MEFIAPCAELWIPESGKLLLVEPRIQGFGIRNPAEIDNSKLMRPVVFLRDQAARSPLQFPPERSLVVESR